MPDREGLGEEGPVRVAVQVDAVHMEPVEQRGEIVGRECGAVPGRQWSELLGAGSLRGCP